VATRDMLLLAVCSLFQPEESIGRVVPVSCGVHQGRNGMDASWSVIGVQNGSCEGHRSGRYTRRTSGMVGRNVLCLYLVLRSLKGVPWTEQRRGSVFVQPLAY
jgi:hypothetical protein